MVNEIDVVLCIETPVYSSVAVIADQSVELLCNTSLTSDIMWTYDTHDPSVYYVFWNGSIAGDKPHLAIKTTGRNFHSLLISNVQLNDSGLYNCYDGKGLRIVGYQLIVNGMYSFISKISLYITSGSVLTVLVYSVRRSSSYNFVQQFRSWPESVMATCLYNGITATMTCISPKYCSVVMF